MAVEDPLPLKLENQSFTIHSWTVDDGNPFNTVLAAVRRADGYLWVLTYTGVFRFDGQQFLAVKEVNDQVFEGVFTSVCLQDSKGRLWVTKNLGVVACIDGADIRVFTKKDGIPAKYPDSIVEDKEGAIWISYPSNRLFRVQGEEMKAVAIASESDTKSAFLLANGPRGKIWTAHGQQLGVILDGQYKISFKHEQSISLLVESGRNGVWISDGQQIWFYKEGSVPERIEHVPTGGIMTLCEDRFGSLWAAVRTEKKTIIFCREGEKFLPIHVLGLNILGMSADRDGNVWVHTRRAGLLQIRRRNVEVLSPTQDFQTGIRSLCEDKDGVRFATGADRTLFRLKGATWELMTPQQGWVGGVADCVASDPQGGIWISTRTNGLYRWEEGRFLRSEDNYFPRTKISHVRLLFNDTKGDLWFAVENSGKLVRYDGAATNFFTISITSQILSMVEDRDGNLWVATASALLMRSPDENTFVEQKLGSRDGHVGIKSLCAGADGCLWIGYRNGGLGRLKNKTFTRFDLGQGFSDKTISQMLEDDNGWLWCAGNKGLFRLQISELDSVTENISSEICPVLCAMEDGAPVLTASSENWPRSFRSRSGELCMSVGTGIAVIRPERSIANSLSSPPVVIKSVTVNGRLLAVYDSYLEPSTGDTRSLVELRGMTKMLSVGPGVRQMGVEFGEISFEGTKNLRYQYRLEGLDDHWVDSGFRSSAFYSMVPPGNYKFQVRGCNNEGVWNSTDIHLKLQIKPFFWQTLWFKGTCILGFMLITGGLVFLVVRRRAMRKMDVLERQQALERERSRIARDMHDDLGAGLTQISMDIAILQNPAVSPEMTHDLLEEVDQRSRDLVKALDEIVWAVNPNNDTLSSMARYFSEFAQSFLQPAGIACRLNVDPLLSDVQVPADRRHELFLALKEALNNIVKHSRATECHFVIKVESKMLNIILADNGRGFEIGPVQSEADGLLNMHTRLERVGGRCVVTSAPGKGTTIAFSLQLVDHK